MLAARGDLDQALRWSAERGLATDDSLSYVSEFDHITLARVLLAQWATEGDAGCLNDVADLLQRLLTAAEAGGRRAASSRSWCSSRSPGERVATSPMPSRLWDGR